jgi:hypothetical protein
LQFLLLLDEFFSLISTLFISFYLAALPSLGNHFGIALIQVLSFTLAISELGASCLVLQSVNLPRLIADKASILNILKQSQSQYSAIASRTITYNRLAKEFELI